MTTLHEFTDPFDGVALDAAKWPGGPETYIPGDTLVVPTVGGGTLTYDFPLSGALDPPHSVSISHNAGFTSGSAGGLVGLGSRAVLEVVQYGTDPNTILFFYTWRDDWWAWFAIQGTTLTTESGGNTVAELTPTFTLDPVSMRFLAIDMTPSGLRFLASPDGVSWRVLSSRKDWIPPAGATFALEIDARQAAVPAGASTYIFGGVNTEPQPSVGAGAGVGTAQYQVLLYDTAGVLKAVFDAPRNIDLDLLLDGVSTHQISFDLNDARITDFVADAGVVVRRKGAWEFATWDVIYDGLHRTDERQISDVNAQIYTTYGRSLEDLLKRRYIQYFAESAQTDKTGPTESVMKAFVNENAGALATTDNGRFRTVLTPITVEADGAQGSTWAGARAQQNLLDVCQELAQFGSVDFDVVRVSGVTFEFRAYYPRRGIDRRATPGNANAFIFSPAMGNVITPVQSKTRTDEIATVTALGQGEGINRAFVVEDGPTISDSPWNDIEFLLEASNEPDAEGLDAAALAKLNDNGPQDKLAFEVAQVAGGLFGRDYNVGDWVTARFGPYSHDLRIVGATISVADGKESIKLQCTDPDTRPPTTASFDPIAALMAELQRLALDVQTAALRQTNPIPSLQGIQLTPVPFGTLPIPLPTAGVGALPEIYTDSHGNLHIYDPNGDGGLGSDTILAGPDAPGGGGSTGGASLEFIVGNGQDLITAGRFTAIDQLPYTLTITEIRAQSVQGDTGGITLTFETFTPGSGPTFTTLATITITGSDYNASTGLSLVVPTGTAIAVSVSGVSTFKQIGAVLVGTKS